MPRCDFWPWPLTRSPWKFVVHQASGDQSLYEIWAKSNNPQPSNNSAVGDLACFRGAILGGCAKLTELSQGCVDQLHQTWREHRAIMGTLHFCFRVRISCCIFKRRRLKFEWWWKRHQIVENYGRAGRELWTNCWSFTYDRTSRIHLMAIHCAAIGQPNYSACAIGDQHDGHLPFWLYACH